MRASPTPDITVVEQARQPYVAVTGHVTMQTFPELADRLPGSSAGWPPTTWRAAALGRGPGLDFEVRPSEAGEVWGCRLKWLVTNPAEQPDRSQWQTRLAFRLADERAWPR